MIIHCSYSILPNIQINFRITISTFNLKDYFCIFLPKSQGNVKLGHRFNRASRLSDFAFLAFPSQAHSAQHSIFDPTFSFYKARSNIVHTKHTWRLFDEKNSQLGSRFVAAKVFRLLKVGQRWCFGWFVHTPHIHHDVFVESRSGPFDSRESTRTLHKEILWEPVSRPIWFSVS